MTQNGKDEQRRRHTPNLAQLRNRNLMPSSFKRMEGKFVKKIDGDKLA